VIIAAAATPAGPTQEDLLIQIRDLLKNKVPLYYMFHNHLKRWFSLLLQL
jgi:hypothetical protein